MRKRNGIRKLFLQDLNFGLKKASLLDKWRMKVFQEELARLIYVPWKNLDDEEREKRRTIDEVFKVRQGDKSVLNNS